MGATLEGFTWQNCDSTNRTRGTSVPEIVRMGSPRDIFSGGIIDVHKGWRKNLKGPRKLETVLDEQAERDPNPRNVAESSQKQDSEERIPVADRPILTDDERIASTKRILEKVRAISRSKRVLSDNAEEKERKHKIAVDDIEEEHISNEVTLKRIASTRNALSAAKALAEKKRKEKEDYGHEKEQIRKSDLISRQDSDPYASGQKDEPDLMRQRSEDIHMETMTLDFRSRTNTDEVERSINPEMSRRTSDDLRIKSTLRALDKAKKHQIAGLSPSRYSSFYKQLDQPHQKERKNSIDPQSYYSAAVIKVRRGSNWERASSYPAFTNDDNVKLETYDLPELSRSRTETRSRGETRYSRDGQDFDKNRDSLLYEDDRKGGAIDLLADLELPPAPDEDPPAIPGENEPDWKLLATLRRWARSGWGRAAETYMYITNSIQLEEDEDLFPVVNAYRHHKLEFITHPETIESTLQEIELLHETPGNVRDPAVRQEYLKRAIEARKIDHLSERKLKQSGPPTLERSSGSRNLLTNDTKAESKSKAHRDVSVSGHLSPRSRGDREAGVSGYFSPRKKNAESRGDRTFALFLPKDDQVESPRGDRRSMVSPRRHKRADSNVARHSIATSPRSHSARPRSGTRLRSRGLSSAAMMPRPLSTSPAPSRNPEYYSGNSPVPDDGDDDNPTLGNLRVLGKDIAGGMVYRSELVKRIESKVKRIPQDDSVPISAVIYRARSKGKGFKQSLLELEGSTITVTDFNLKTHMKKEKELAKIDMKKLIVFKPSWTDVNKPEWNKEWSLDFLDQSVNLKISFCFASMADKEKWYFLLKMINDESIWKAELRKEIRMATSIMQAYFHSILSYANLRSGLLMREYIDGKLSATKVCQAWINGYLSKKKLCRHFSGDHYHDCADIVEQIIEDKYTPKVKQPTKDSEPKGFSPKDIDIKKAEVDESKMNVFDDDFKMLQSREIGSLRVRKKGGVKACVVKLEGTNVVFIDKSSIRKAIKAGMTPRILASLDIENTSVRAPSIRKVEDGSSADNLVWSDDFSMDISDTDGRMISLCIAEKDSRKEWLLAFGKISKNIRHIKEQIEAIVTIQSWIASYTSILEKPESHLDQFNRRKARLENTKEHEPETDKFISDQTERKQTVIEDDPHFFDGADTMDKISDSFNVSEEIARVLGAGEQPSEIEIQYSSDTATVSSSATRIQSTFRGWTKSRQYQRKRFSSKVIQASILAYLSRIQLTTAIEQKKREEAENKKKEEAERKKKEVAELKAREEAKQEAEQIRIETERKAKEEEAKRKKLEEKRLKEKATCTIQSYVFGYLSLEALKKQVATQKAERWKNLDKNLKNKSASKSELLVSSSATERKRSGTTMFYERRKELLKEGEQPRGKKLSPKRRSGLDMFNRRKKMLKDKNQDDENEAQKDNNISRQPESYLDQPEKNKSISDQTDDKEFLIKEEKHGLYSATTNKADLQQSNTSEQLLHPKSAILKPDSKGDQISSAETSDVDDANIIARSDPKAKDEKNEKTEAEYVTDAVRIRNNNKSKKCVLKLIGSTLSVIDVSSIQKAKFRGVEPKVRIQIDLSHAVLNQDFKHPMPQDVDPHLKKCWDEWVMQLLDTKSQRQLIVCLTSEHNRSGWLEELNNILDAQHQSQPQKAIQSVGTEKSSVDPNITSSKVGGVNPLVAEANVPSSIDIADDTAQITQKKEIGTEKLATPGFEINENVLEISSINIQAAVQAYLLGIDLKIERERRKKSKLKQLRAVEVIQSIIRGWMLSKKCKDLKILRETEKVRKHNKIVDATFTIQTACRVYISIQKLKVFIRVKRRERVQSTIVIQSHFRGWMSRKKYAYMKRENQRRKQDEMLKATIKIQTALRAYISVKELKEAIYLQRKEQTRATIVIQSQIRGWLDRKEYIALKAERKLRIQAQTKMASRAIQAALRAYLVTQKLKDSIVTGSAIVIQSYARGWISRKKFNSIKDEEKSRKQAKLKASAKVIQVFLRVQLATQKLKDFIVQQEEKIKSAVIIQCYIRGWISRKKYGALKEQRTKSAIVIQSHIRGWISRKQYHSKREEKKVRIKTETQASAKVIQASIRAQLTRKKLENYILAKQRQRNKSATVIQSHIRGWMSRKRYHTMKEEEKARIQAETQTSAEVIQAFVRAQLATQKRDDFIVVKQGQRNQSATVIQSHVRGWMSRKKYHAMKEEENTRMQAEIKASVGVVQACIQAQLTKKKLENNIVVQQKQRNKSATVIQSHIRGWMSRKKYHAMKEEENSRIQAETQASAEVIQASIRAQFATQKLENYVVEKQGQRNKSATVIQSHVRGWMSRKKYHAMKMEENSRIQAETQASAEVIQAYMRTQFATWNLENYMVEKQRQRNKSATVIQSHVRGWMSRKRYQAMKEEENYRIQAEMRASAEIIQASVRTQLAARKLKDFIELKQRQKLKSAILIQSHVRGWISRKKYYSMKEEEKARKQAEIESSAIDIQTATRAYQLLTSVKVSIFERQRREEKEKCESAVALQMHIRAILAFSRVSSSIASKNIELRKSTIIIQSGIRSRMYFSALNESLREKKEKERCIACSVIQPAVYGHLSLHKLRMGLQKRKEIELKLKTEASFTMQALITTILSQARFRTKLKVMSSERMQNAVVIQSVVREWISKQRFVSSVRRRQKSARNIQAAIRARIMSDKVINDIVARRERERARNESLKKSAKTVQSYVRSYVSHKNLCYKLNQKRKCASAIVQSAIFTYFARKLLRDKIETDLKEKILASQSIQALTRSYCLKSLLLTSIEERVLYAKTIQLAVCSHFAHQNMKTELSRRKIAMTTLQSLIQQYLARKCLESAINQRKQLLNESTVLIQTWIRSFLNSCELKQVVIRKQRSVVTIQAASAQFLVRKKMKAKLSRFESATISLQAAVRMYCKSKQLQSKIKNERDKTKKRLKFKSPKRKKKKPFGTLDKLKKGLNLGALMSGLSKGPKSPQKSVRQRRTQSNPETSQADESKLPERPRTQTFYHTMKPKRAARGRSATKARFNFKAAPDLRMSKEGKESKETTKLSQKNACNDSTKSRRTTKDEGRKRTGSARDSMSDYSRPLSSTSEEEFVPMSPTRSRSKTINKGRKRTGTGDSVPEPPMVILEETRSRSKTINKGRKRTGTGDSVPEVPPVTKLDENYSSTRSRSQAIKLGGPTIVILRYRQDKKPKKTLLEFKGPDQLIFKRVPKSSRSRSRGSRSVSPASSNVATFNIFESKIFTPSSQSAHTSATNIGSDWNDRWSMDVLNNNADAGGLVRFSFCFMNKNDFARWRPVLMQEKPTRPSDQEAPAVPPSPKITSGEIERKRRRALSRDVFVGPHPKAFKSPTLKKLLSLQMSCTKAKVPLIMIELVNAIKTLRGLQTKGIFRLAASKKQRDDFEAKISRSKYQVPANLSPHVPACTLKKFLRGLRKPIVPSFVYQMCLAVAEDPKKSLEGNLVEKVLQLMPKENRNAFEFIVKFILDVASPENQKENKMDIHNLATVFAPCLLRNPSKNPADLVENVAFEIEFVEIVAKHWLTDS